MRTACAFLTSGFLSILVRLWRITIPALLLGALALWTSESLHAQLTTIGAIGDSYTDEYSPLPWGGHSGDPSAMSWVELLMLTRGPTSERPELTFGSYEQDRDVRWAPRYAGYEYNWARTGATTYTILSEGQHTGVASQVSSGEVDFVGLLMGGNDFTFINANDHRGIFLGMVNVYEPVYNQQIPFTGSDGNTYYAVEDYVASIVDRYTTAVDTVIGAGGRMILGTLVDYGSEAWTLPRYPDPSKRQHVTDAVAAVNDGVRALAAERGLYGVDYGGLVDLYHSPDPLIVGGVEIIKGRPSSPDPYYFYIPDGGHPGIVIEGLVANTFIEAMNRRYGTEITPLSDQELLVAAGIPDPGGTPTYFDVTQFVIIPEPSSLVGLITGLIVLCGLARRPNRG